MVGGTAAEGGGQPGPSQIQVAAKSMQQAASLTMSTASSSRARVATCSCALLSLTVEGTPATPAADSWSKPLHTGISCMASGAASIACSRGGLC